MAAILERRLFVLLLLAASVVAYRGRPADTVDARFVSGGDTIAKTHLEVADTPEERRRGLMFVENLPERQGMLFVFEDEAPRSFWMKNTYIPLDMIFLDSNKTAVAVKHAEPEPGVPDEELKRYTARAKYVVEMERGFAEKYGVGEGDRLEW